MIERMAKQHDAVRRERDDLRADNEWLWGRLDVIEALASEAPEQTPSIRAIHRVVTELLSKYGRTR